MRPLAGRIAPVADAMRRRRSALAAAALLLALLPSATRAEPSSGTATIWHLGHSGVAVETRDHLLIFDYSDDRPAAGARRSLAGGVVEPSEIAGNQVVVFISHEHHDHFWRDAIYWREGVPGLRFVVSPEVAEMDERFAARPGAIDVLPPDSEARVGELRVETLRSTDSGVAFIVEVDGLTIYHAGDHSAWTWDGDAESTRRFVEENLRPLDGRTIDIAFTVADPRFSDLGWGGVVEFAGRLAPRLLVPIHLRGDYSKMDLLAEEVARTGFAGELWRVSRRGESRTYARPAAAGD